MNLIWNLIRMLGLLWVSTTCKAMDVSKDQINLRSKPEYWLKLGSKGSHRSMDSVTGFMKVTQFLNNYVYKSQPLKMRAAVANSPARWRWTDQYFMSLDIPESQTFLVQNGKGRTQGDGDINMHFHDFIKQYKQKGLHIQDALPSYLGKDVVLPEPLQCKQFSRTQIQDSFLWMSGHNDQPELQSDFLENIHCVYGGSAEVVMFDPKKVHDDFADDLEIPGTIFRGVDVSKVDYKKYPELGEIPEFVKTTLSAGDCIYLPFKWFYYIQSHDRYLAVSTWWENVKVNKETYSDVCKCADENNNTALTLDKVYFSRRSSYDYTFSTVTDSFIGLLKKDSKSVDEFVEFFVDRFPSLKSDDTGVARELLAKACRVIDLNQDGLMTRNEAEDLSVREWIQVANIMDFTEMQYVRPLV